MSSKIVKLPHLRASHVVNPLAPEASEPPQASRTASEADLLSGLWSSVGTDDPIMGEPTEVSFENLWEGGLEAARALTASEGADVDVEPYTGPRPSGRSARFRVDRPPRETFSRERAAAEFARAAEEPPVVVRSSRPIPAAAPPPVRPLTPMQRAAQYTDRTASLKRHLRDD